MFAAGDARETTGLRDVRGDADGAFEVWQNMLGFGPEGWDPAQDDTGAVALCKKMKEEALSKALSEEERGEVMVHWPLDDMVEKKYV